MITERAIHVVVFDGFADLLRKSVTARRISKKLLEKGPHALEHGRIDRCCRIIIEIKQLFRLDHGALKLRPGHDTGKIIPQGEVRSRDA